MFERMTSAAYRQQLARSAVRTSLDIAQRQPRAASARIPRRGVPNTWEQAYYEECIHPLILDGQIVYAEFEQWTCILVPPGEGDTSLKYTPDYHVIWASGQHEFVEVKGRERRSGTDRWKMAADKFPWADWRMVTKRKDGWEILRYRPAYSQ